MDYSWYPYIHKIKNKLFKEYFKNKNFDTDKSKKEHYKKYSNKLTHVKNLAKRICYENVIKCNAKKVVVPSAISIKDEKVRTVTLKFAESLCEYCVDNGAKMSKKLPCSDTFFFEIHGKSCMLSCVLHDITPEEVSYCISNIEPYFCTRNEWNSF